MKEVPNSKLRLQIVEMIYRSKEGHIPSSFSIIDIIESLYRSVLSVDALNPDSPLRDFFVLSKGHGAAALFVVLHKFGFIPDSALEEYGRPHGILGGHPDSKIVPGAEFSTGSLGHGFPMGVGVAMGLKIKKQSNQVFVLVGDGECHEGSIWESAHVAANNSLDNLTVIVDWNGSASQLMPVDDLPQKWRAFGWDTLVIDGHSSSEIENACRAPRVDSKPRAIIARTKKGYGVDFLVGHGKWHHRIPSEEEMQLIRTTLSAGGDDD